MKISIKTPIAIVGLGLSGESVLSLLSSLGIPRHDIITFDEKSLSAQVSDPERLLNEYQPKTLVISPGVPLSKPWIKRALDQGIAITSEINLATTVLENEILIGITGSVGKSTVTSLVGEVLTALDKNTFVGGNLGKAFCDYARDVFEKKRPRAKWVVLELSSYQLENCRELHLSAAAITSFTPNHLERYNSLEDYYLTKLRIIDMCNGPVLLNKNSLDLAAHSAKIKSLYPKKQVHWSSNEKMSNFFDFSKARLIGKHNQQNLALAADLLLKLGLQHEQLGSLNDFPGLSHRTEFFGKWNDVTFVNDSKATSIESVQVAVDSCLPLIKSGHKLHLLLGGRDKNLPWENLKNWDDNETVVFYFFGESKDLIPKKSGLSGPSFENLTACFEFLMNNVQKNDVVLFSPGGTSLDEFKNFEARGNFFKELVQTYYSSR